MFVKMYAFVCMYFHLIIHILRAAKVNTQELKAVKRVLLQGEDLPKYRFATSSCGAIQTNKFS